MVYSVPKTVRSNLKLGKVKDGVRAAGALVSAGSKVASGAIRHTRGEPKKPTMKLPKVRGTLGTQKEFLGKINSPKVAPKTDLGKSVGSRNFFLGNGLSPNLGKNQFKKF
jgi:hypothetical protein